MQYLTTHDLVWINSSITGANVPYNYVTLESAMAGQYSYGQSADVQGQAANLFGRLLFKSPFEQGNRRTALVAALTFLNANGYETRVTDQEAAGIVQNVCSGSQTPEQAITGLCTPAEGSVPGAVALRKLISHECNAHREALVLLSSGD